MERYSIYCSEEQTKKALELGAPIESQTSSTLIDTPCAFCDDGMYIIPTAEQMIGWLEKDGDLITIYHEIDWLFSINHFEGVGRFNSRKEATLAAIDAALDYLSKNKE